MIPLDDCDYTCQECGRTVCADERPSPGEPYICDDCHNLGRALADHIEDETTDYSWGGDAA